ncbi:hypothetical protein I316_02038 [Kwoniella heveanensis BCC8398]|uniref:Cyclin N-terminal domain-containing protein n=1 Tax=Kwoniella heveanensis BCC8398 TaxID=1296120 RepID=A0A1B9GYQ5_9TREE|nr:hypothetical protein I316_02038 [Kwoniella heveanensis BCC8398]
MCSENTCSFPSSSSSRLLLPLLNTPPTLHYDQISNHDGSVSEQETVLESPSDALVAHHFVKQGQRSPEYFIRSPSAVKLGKRPASPHLVTPPSSPRSIHSEKRFKMDMHMAEKGSVAALSAFQTPLATYVAHMVVWLWYGDFQSAVQNAPSSPLSSTSIPHDPFDVSHTPTSRISPLMVQPSIEFSKFVGRLLTVTSVSHSVTLVALLYIYRLKMKNQFYATPGSEQRPFVAALMLGNKYLDDNTYTNSTWAELAGMQLQEINRMEKEFLDGLGYDLGVDIDEYQRWKMLLDEFMLSRSKTSNVARHTRQLSAGKSPYNSAKATSPLVPTSSSMSYRARSASPPRVVPPSNGSYAFPAALEHARKRSAVDAFNYDSLAPANVYEALRMPVKKAAFTQPLQSTQHLQPSGSVVRARPAAPQQNFNTSVARSSSLSRRHARLPAGAEQINLTRRGSAGHIFTPVSSSHQISPAAQAAATMSVNYQPWADGRALLAPYDCQPPSLVPPEHLMFYTLAAEPHPGADGAPRKAILRYQDPMMVPSYPPQPQYGFSMATPSHLVPSSVTTPSFPPYEDVNMYEPSNSPLAAFPANMYQYPQGPDPAIQPPSAQPQAPSQAMYDPTSSYPVNLNWSPMHVEPEPAQFANAGPPGVAYVPSATSHWKGARPTPNPTCQATIGLGLNTSGNISTPGFVPTYGTYNGEPVYAHGIHVPMPTDGTQWASRSEWSSPVFPRY